MALFGNSAEGGSNGVSVSTGNSGGASGNAWNAVVGGAAIAYTTSSPLKDSVSITESLSGGSAQYVEWTFTGTATAVARWYAQWSALPSASFGHMAFLAGSTRLVDIRVDTLGQMSCDVGCCSMHELTLGRIGAILDGANDDRRIRLVPAWVWNPGLPHGRGLVGSD